MEVSIPIAYHFSTSLFLKSAPNSRIWTLSKFSKGGYADNSSFGNETSPTIIILLNNDSIFETSNFQYLSLPFADFWKSSIININRLLFDFSSVAEIEILEYCLPILSLTTRIMLSSRMLEFISDPLNKTGNKS